MWECLISAALSAFNRIEQCQIVGWFTAESKHNTLKPLQCTGPGFNPQPRTASYQRRYRNGTSSSLVWHSALKRGNSSLILQGQWPSRIHLISCAGQTNSEYYFRLSNLLCHSPCRYIQRHSNLQGVNCVQRDE